MTFWSRTGLSRSTIQLAVIVFVYEIVYEIPRTIKSTKVLQFVPRAHEWIGRTRFDNAGDLGMGSSRFAIVAVGAILIFY